MNGFKDVFPLEKSVKTADIHLLKCDLQKVWKAVLK